MPCHDPRPHDDYKAEYDRVTDMLCRTCEIMESKSVITGAPLDVQLWWKQHKKMDELRKRGEGGGSPIGKFST